MNNSIVPFDFDGQPVRVVKIDGEPWFVTSDIALVLDLSNMHSSLALLEDDERRLHSVETNAGARQVTVISESGVYSLVLRSRKPEAKAFKRWLTRDVLPEIRKTGSYGTTPALTGPELMARALIEAQTVLEAKDNRIAELEPKAHYVDVFVADGDLMKIRTIASNLNVAEGWLRELLLTSKWIYVETATRWSEKKQEKETVRRYSAYSDKRSYFEPVQNHEAPRFKGEVMHTLKVTPAGAEAIARLVRRQGLEVLAS